MGSNHDAKNYKHPAHADIRLAARGLGMQERLLVQSNALLPVCWSRTSDATQALVELNNLTDIIPEFHNIVVATQNLPSRINGWLTEPQLTDAVDRRSMDPEPTTCRIRVRWGSGDVPHVHAIRSLADIKDLPDMTKELQQRWAEEIVRLFLSNPGPIAAIRPWDILLHQHGSVVALLSEKGGRSFYPSRFRIPPHNVLGLDKGERVTRAERFALGTLLYEVMTAKEPFEELSEEEVQDHYRRGIFPDDVFSMAMGPYILGCWSLEFEKEMERLLAESGQVSIGGRFRAYAKAHPFLLASQVAGGVVMTASVIALPGLGLAGFAATGPVAGTAVTAWQSSIGIVQAGSLFAWCQSAAMGGGAAVNGIIACGAVGGSVALVATGGAIAGGQTVLTPEKMKEMFLMAYRKENSGLKPVEAADESTN